MRCLPTLVIMLCFGGLGSAEETTRLQHDVMRCAKSFDVNACDAALRSKPDDPEILVAKGDALSHDGRPADAILLYLRAGGLLPPGDEGIKLKLSAAEAQREGLAAQCQVSADAAAADACQAALLRGSADEPALLARRRVLLQSFDRPVTPPGNAEPVKAAKQGAINSQTRVGVGHKGLARGPAKSASAAVPVPSTNAVTYSNDASAAQTN